MLVSLQRAGVTCVEQGGRRAEIGAGRFFMVDPTRPFKMETTQESQARMMNDPDAWSPA